MWALNPFWMTQSLDHTFLSFLILEGGHLPFFLKCRFRRSRFLFSLIFFAIFIFCFCSSIIWALDSNGRFSTDTGFSDFSFWVSGLFGSFPSTSSTARAITSRRSGTSKGLWIQTLPEGLGWTLRVFLCNLETGRWSYEIQKVSEDKNNMNKHIERYNEQVVLI